MFIGTLSLNINTDDLNYGALMHSWAFQKFIEKHFGYKTEIIDYTTPQLQGKGLKYPVLYLIREGSIRQVVSSLLKTVTFAKRYDKFKSFIGRELRVSSIKYTQDSLNKATLPYSVVICESDVIWSTDFFKGGFDKTFFCYLDSMKSLKKIIYAASMANADLNEKQAAMLREYIKDLKYISCRESYAVEKVSRYTDQIVHHVVDPVLLLESDDYESIIGPRIIKENYLLIYLPVGNNKQVVENAHLFAIKHNLKVVEISNSVRSLFKHKVIMDAGIEEWFSLIYHASAIFTDSFHAVCFSIIFHKDFYSFSRKTGRKIEDVCLQFGLSNRYFTNEFKEQKPIDYSVVDEILKLRRAYSIKYLETALGDYS